MFSPDGFGGGEDQAENSRSHNQREMSDLPHPPPPQPLCHRCPGCLLLQHLRSHHLLPAGTDEWYKGRETNINSPGIIILPAGGVKELHLICFFCRRTSWWISSMSTSLQLLSPWPTSSPPSSSLWSSTLRITHRPLRSASLSWGAVDRVCPYNRGTVLINNNTSVTNPPKGYKIWLWHWNHSNNVGTTY